MRAIDAIDVLCVSMPFGPLQQGSIGLELLRAGLAGLRTRTLYLTLRFAARIGVPAYRRIGEAPEQNLLAGEWVFRDALFPRDDADSERYLRLLEGGDSISPGLPPGEIADLLDARRHVDRFLDDAVEQVVAAAPRVVAFTSSFSQHVASLALARRLREAMPGIRLVIGGANCSGPMGVETARQFSFMDAVVSGEADALIRPLVDALLAGASVDQMQGVHTRESATSGGAAGSRDAEPVTRLDALPIPSYDDYFEQLEASGVGGEIVPIVPTEWSRGCWWGARHHCTFCGLNQLTMAFRSKSADRIIRELTVLTERYPKCPITAVDNILDMAYFKELLPELARRRLDVQLFFEVKANLRRDQLQLLRDAGIVRIQPGIESLSSPILRLMRKGVTALQNVQLLKWCAELGIQPTWNLLWGFPHEPVGEYDRMARLIPRLTHLTPPVWYGAFHLDRFSPYFDEHEAFGLVGVEPAPAYRHVYPLPGAIVTNLAYYFAFERRNGPPLVEYTESLRQELERWQVAYETSLLCFTETGSELQLFDSRPGASRPLTSLRGLERTLYLASDHARTVESLAQAIGVDQGLVRTSLAPLIEQGLLLEEDGRVLALATATRGVADRVGSAPPALREFDRHAPIRRPVAADTVVTTGGPR
jgi:ribosomal peptide maturation radical SAM protein 1